MTVGKEETELGDLLMSGNERDAKPGLRPRSEVLLAHQRRDSKAVSPSRTGRVKQLGGECDFSSVLGHK